MVAKGLAGKKFAPGGPRQPWWRDVRLRPGKSRLLIWLHTALTGDSSQGRKIKHHFFLQNFPQKKFNLNSYPVAPVPKTAEFGSFVIVEPLANRKKIT